MAPSDRTPIGKRLWTALREQRTGVVCALTSAALLALGSVLMDRYPERYHGLGMDDLRYFVEPPSFDHVWLYALALTLAVWASSALVCTIDSVGARIRRRVLRPSAYGAPLLHLTFVLGLGGHLWGGLTAESRRLELGPAGAEIAGARYAPRRLVREDHPNGQPRDIAVILERRVDGRVDEVEIGYNRPLILEAGALEILLARYGVVPVAVLVHRGERVALGPGQSSVVAGDELTLGRIHPGNGQHVAVAEVLLRGDEPARLLLPLGPGRAGAVTTFAAIEEAPVLLLTERRNPSMPLVWVTALLAVLGVLLVGWERVRRNGADPGA